MLWDFLHKANSEIAQYLLVDRKNGTRVDWSFHILNIPDSPTTKDQMDYSPVFFIIIISQFDLFM